MNQGESDREKGKDHVADVSLLISFGHMQKPAPVQPHQTCSEVVSQVPISSCIPSTHHWQMERWNSLWDRKAAEREAVLFPICTTVPSTIGPSIRDATLLPQGKTEQDLEEISTAAAISWMDKENRARRASWGVHLKAVWERGTKSMFPWDINDVPLCYSTHSKELRPSEDREEWNTWPLSACLISFVGFKVRRNNSCQCDLL